MIPRSHAKPGSGQGALEYLLLIGGAVLVATIVLVMVVGGIFPNTSGLIDTNLNRFQHSVNLDAAGNGPGGPGAQCPDGGLDAGEQCDGAVFLGGNSDCSAWGAFLPGTNVTCNTPASCTVNTSSCTPSSGGAPSFVSFSGDATGTDLGQMNVLYAISNAPTSADLCYGTASLAGVTAGNFAADCATAGGTVAPLSTTAGPQTLPLSGLTSNQAYNFVAVAANGSGTSLIASTSAATKAMADFLTLDWSTTSIVLFNDAVQNNNSRGWTLTNTASSSLAVTSFTPVFSGGTATVMTGIKFNSGGFCANAVSVSSGTPLVGLSGIGNCTIASGTTASTGTRINYDSAVHGGGSDQSLTFGFSDGSTYSTGPHLKEVLASPMAAGGCVGTTYSPAALSQILVTDRSLPAFADYGVAQHWSLSPPPGATGVAFASLMHNISAESGTPSSSSYMIPLDAAGFGNPCANAALDQSTNHQDLNPSGLAGEPPEVPLAPYNTVVPLSLIADGDSVIPYNRYYDVGSQFNLSTTDLYYVLTGANAATLNTDYRSAQTSNAAGGANLLVAYNV